GAPALRIGGDRQIVHVLSRLTYGPRPGDLERVRAMGVSAWIERQLRPETIDDSATERALAELPALRMPITEALAAIPAARSQAPGAARRRRDVAAGNARALSGREAPGPDRDGATVREGRPRRHQRAAARRAHGRVLVQPLQRVRRQGRRALVRG